MSGKTLSRDERRALLNHHVGKLRLALGEVNKAREPLTEAQAELTSAVNAAKSDLGKAYTRKRLMALVEDTQARLRNLLKEEEDRYQDRLDLGLPVYGEQQDLFGADPEKTPESARDALYWEAQGFLAGRHGWDRAAPDGCPPEHDPVFLKGWDKGQAETQDLVAQAMLAKQRVDAPDTSPPVKMDEPEPSIAEQKAAERKATRKARESLDAMSGAAANEVPA